MTTTKNNNTTDNYSAFDCLVVAEQTQSGLLQKESQEVEVFVWHPLELRASDEPMVPLNDKHQVDVPKSNLPWKDRIGNLMMQLTTHRTVFWSETSTKRECRYLHHSQLLQLYTESGGGLFQKSPKVIIQTAAMGELCLVFPTAKKRDECFHAYQKVVSRKGWEPSRTTTTTTTTTTIPRRRVGLDALLTSDARRHEHAAQLAETAFQGDAELLLKEAQGLVQIIQQYVATLERQQEFNNTEDKETQQLVGMLQHMGMTSALPAYDTQLARELADFVRPHLTATHPVMTLTDVYCLYNRARATHLLSPDDFRAAAEQCQKLSVGISVATLPSGLVVLQNDQYADPVHLQERLTQLLQDHSLMSLTAMDVSRYWRISAVLAMEQLKVVEQCGSWVRDETLESLRFYPNRYFL
jgi:ESCRT-II complex subunit VPS36